MQDLNISIIQANLIWENPEQNLADFQIRLDKITTDPDLIILPEMFNTGFTMNVDKCAEKEKGLTVTWLKEQAKKKDCIICGSLLIEDENKFFNRMFWMHPEGTFETYNKRHLFRMGDEHLTMSQGNRNKIIELNGWKINLQICYDLRFPVWSKNNYSDGNYEYDLLIYIANWPKVRNHAYKSLLLARAIENQAYVLWVNRIGEDGNGVLYSGDSMIIDPYGKIVTMAEESAEQIIESAISYEKLKDYREKFGVGLDWDKFDIHE